MGAHIPKPFPGRPKRPAPPITRPATSEPINSYAVTQRADETVESLRRRLELAIRGLNAVASIAQSDSYTNRSRADQMESILRVVERAKADVTAGISGQDRGA